MGFIYVVTNEVNNKKYVGQTTALKVETRWRQHKYGGVGPCLLKAYRKHGYHNFRYEVLCECPNEDCDSLEIQYIKELDTLAPRGYNLQGGGLNFSVHPDTRRKISESKIGKPRSEETKAKVSESSKGKIIPPEVRSKISETMMGLNVGKTHTEESKLKMRQARVGIKLSEEHRANIGKASKGRKMSEEQKKKISDSLKKTNELKRLNLCIPHLDDVVDQDRRETGNEVRAAAILLAVDEGVREAIID